MADSFFGFNTTLPIDDDGGGEDGHEDEDEYDALNDETFGEAINGDWEGMHENLVRLDEFRFDNINSEVKSNSDHDSDLEINLARVGLEDCDVSHDDTEARLQLDPSVWSSPSKSLIPQKKNSNDIYGLYGNPELFLRQNFSQPFNNFPQQPFHGNQQQRNIGKTSQSSQMSHIPHFGASGPNKIVTVEDIERNIRNQTQQPKAPLPNSIPKPMLGLTENIMHSQMANHMMHQQVQRPQGPPPGMHSLNQQQSRTPIFQSHHGQNSSQQNRFPPGFSSLHLMGGPQLGNTQNVQQAPQMPLMLNRNLSQNIAHLPIIQQMHTNFGTIRPPSSHPMSQMQLQPPPQKHTQMQTQQQQQQLLPPQQVAPRMPQLLVSQHYPQNLQNLQNSVNQFNKRLVQEIQQNHPLLAQLNRGNVNPTINNNNGYVNSMYAGGSSNNNNNKNSQSNHSRHDGNLNTEFDEYSNLMSTRDKQWLLGIQLMQLNTETPYIDDFYFTVYKERQKQNKGEFESKAHKDNTLNHPLTQPKGHHHAQLLIMLGKNGSNQRNGTNNRERKISENSIKTQNDKDLPQRTYTLLQFENSLGKLQCGSVTAPRKIIDMDIVGPEIINTFNNTNEISAQRRSRQLLLHIETLYKIVLKMEDLQNPIAIEAALIMKEKKDKEKQAAIEQSMMEQLNNDGAGQCGAGGDSANESKNSSLSASDKNEPETFTELLPRLLNGLTSDKVTVMMTVRKGKNLLRRIMPLIRDQIQKWDIWCDILSTLSVIVKKDREDADGLLINFYPEFRKQIQYAGMDDIIRIISSLQHIDPKQQKTLNIDSRRVQYIIDSKFCILLVISIILRVEQFYTISDALVNPEQKHFWLIFINLLSNCSNLFISKNNAQQQSSLSNNNEMLKALTNHFSRFCELKSTQNLLNFLSQHLLK